MEFIYNKNTELYYASSKELGLPVEIVEPIGGFAFRLGMKRYFFRGFDTPLNNCSSENLAQNKFCTNKVLEAADVPVPKIIAVHVEQFRRDPLDSIVSALKFPLVIKPLNESLGRDVICNVRSVDCLKGLMHSLFSNYEWLLLEEYHGGLNSYRILVLKGKIIGVIQRYSARVIGDGQHTVDELIAITNRTRKQIGDELAPIRVDADCQLRLQERGITLTYIPALDEVVMLSHTSNASRGGSYEALDIDLCEHNWHLFIKINKLLNLNFSGIDVECVDLKTPIVPSTGVIIEVNPNPSIRIHERPQAGKPNRVTKKVIQTIIYRHPFAYFVLLYKNPIVSPYIRSFLLITGLMLIYLFLIKAV